MDEANSLSTAETRKERIVTLVCAFVLPVLLAAPAFASAGIYPFGDKSLLIVDMYNEYIDYFVKMNISLHESGSFLRSWSMGMGLNMLGLIAFYTSSPFNIIVLLLPISCVTEAVFAVTLLKLGLAGLFFAIFALEAFPSADRIFHVVLAVAYALSAYNFAYSSNIMWLDGSAFLPLVLLGVERINKKGRYGLFIFSLVYVFFTSYYIGYMIGVFSFLYLAANHFALQKDIRAFARILPRFIGSAALAAGCCAFLLLPAFLNLKSGQNEMWSVPFEAGLKYPVVRLASKLLPGAYDSLTDSGLPNIYCTVFGVSMYFLYFITKAVPRREKLIYGGLTGFMLLSFSCEFLDLAWHAFEDPTWFPARYSFVFSFLILFLALRCASVLDNISRNEVISSACLLSLLFIEVAINRYYHISLKLVAAGLVLATIYALIPVMWKTRNRRALSVLLVLFVCMESFGNAAFMVLGMDWQFGYRSRSEYYDFMADYGGAVKRLESLDSGVYRAEILGQRNANGPMALSYNGISHYSTTTDQSLNRLLRDLGYNTGTVNELRFSKSTPLTNGLLGIKYVLSKEPICDAYTLIESVGDIGIYENTAAFPMAFWSPAGASSFVPDPENGPFAMQNDILGALLGEDVSAFACLEAGGEGLMNIEKILNDDHIQYDRQIRNRDAYIDFTAPNPHNGEAYAFFPVYDGKFSGSDVYIDGELHGRDFAYRSNTIIPLGNNARSSLRIVPGGDRLRISKQYFASLDIEAAKKSAGKAASNKLEFTKFHDTVVEGKIAAPEDGLLATTFPYDEGWSVTVDGLRVKPERLLGVFLSVPVTKGEHTVTMRYLPQGFAAGAVISAMSVIGILIWYALKRRTRRV